MVKKIGILTGGGDCPGLNAAIRAIVRKGIEKYGYEFLGIKKGWAGLLNMEVSQLNLGDVSGILHVGGTIIGTSRTNPLKSVEETNRVINNYKELELYALIAIGGDDTLGVALELSKRKLNIVGLPKTIDNDLSGTDRTFGFDTAVTIATEAIDRLHSTAESHHRVMVVEVMGRNAGWIAVYSGIAGGADVILIPEEPIEISEVCKLVKRRKARGKTFSIVVVAEGAKIKEKGKEVEIAKTGERDEFGHIRLGGIGEVVAELIKEKIGIDTRTTILGHVQRGGTPTAYDRILATQYGLYAIDLVHRGEFGKMVSLQGSKIVSVELEKAVSKNRYVDKETYEMAKVFFG